MKVTKLALVAALACSGCASIEYSSPGKLDGIAFKGAKGPATQLVSIEGSELYMLGGIPIISGDLRWDSQTRSIKGGSSAFASHTTLQELQNSLLKLAESRNCDVVDVFFGGGDASLADASYQGAVGALLGVGDVRVTAVLVPRKK